MCDDEQNQMVTGDPGIWLDTYEDWLLFEDLPAEIEEAVRQALTARDISLERTSDHSWSIDGPGSAVVLAIDDMLESQLIGSVCQRHGDGCYTWTLTLPGTAETQETVPEEERAGKHAHDLGDWSEILLTPEDNGVTVQLSSLADEPIYWQMVKSGFRLSPKQPSDGPEDPLHPAIYRQILPRLDDTPHPAVYHVASEVAQVRKTLTCWLLEGNLSYIKSVPRRSGRTQILITDKI